MEILLEKVLSPLTHENELEVQDSAECQIQEGTNYSHSNPMALDLQANIRLYAVLLNKANGKTVMFHW
jgi:hypothetical protein